MARTILLLTAITLALTCWVPTMASAKTIYVKADASGAATGTSWADAFRHLKDGLAAAVAGDEIWVAAGTYKPDQGKGITPGDRSATFNLVRDVAVYGGFSGGEKNLPERDWQKNRTILSGDLKGNDLPGFVNYTENSNCVVTFSSTATTAPFPTAILDGVTISHGSYGGLDLKNTSPLIRNCTTRDNKATYGGGAYSSGGNPTIANCIVRDNSATHGAGLYLSSSAASITNCTIIGNSATIDGGGVYFYSGNPTVTNSILWGNNAPSGPEAYMPSGVTGTPSIVFSDVRGGQSVISGKAGGITYQNNINVDPILTVDGHLQPGSPCIDRGDNAAAVTTDIDGEARPAGAATDIGVDEFVDADNDRLPDAWEIRWFSTLATTDNGSNDSDGDGLSDLDEFINATNPATPDSDNDGQNDFMEISRGTDPLDRYSFSGQLYVNRQAKGSNTGLNWTDAFPSLRDALSLAGNGIEIWVAAGTYKPDQGKSTTPGDRNETFQLKPGVAVYGGFTGNETDLHQRDWQKNKTILSGDLKGDDQAAFTNYADNSYHVVSASGTASMPSILDGFVVTHGAANAPLPSINTGGGLYLYTANPVIRNCVITENVAKDGGGVFMDKGKPVFTNCVIRNNRALRKGGGLGIYESTPSITNCTIMNNTSLRDGGGIYSISASPIIINGIVWGNIARYAGPQVDVYSGRITILYSNVQGGQGGISVGIYNPPVVTYQNNIAVDPLLTADGHIKTGSPCIDTGDNAASVTYDFDGEARPAGTAIDIGADEFVDADSDRLPDAWEIRWFGNLARNGGADMDGDGLIDLDEFINATNPANPDTDIDGQNDFMEISRGTDPLDPYSYSGRYYVDQQAKGGNTGLNWIDAFSSLQDALSVAGKGMEIWVAAGTYKPDQGKDVTPGDRDASFWLKPGVAVHGGFAGNETNLHQRNSQKNKTILSGDLKGDDRPGFTNYADNSSHVVSAIESSPIPAILDGFVVTHGNGGGESGGGLYLSSANPLIRNCVITENEGKSGGGVYVSRSETAFSNCVIRNNLALDLTGGGGGLKIFSSSASLTNCTIINNLAAKYGGGIYSVSSNPVVTNGIIWGNSADTGPQAYVGSGGLTVLYSAVHGGQGGMYLSGTATITYQNNIDADPLSADGHLQAGSPCIDAGDPAATETNDIDGEKRPNGPRIDMGADEFIDSDMDTLPDAWEIMWFGNLARNGGTDMDGDGLTDMDEYLVDSDPTSKNTGPIRLHVDGNAAGRNTGHNWTDAFGSLRDALAAASAGAEIWIAAGTYRPDQGVGITPGDRYASFNMKPNVFIYGGFAGNETSLFERDVNKNRTMLSGDLKGDDQPGFVNYGENSFNVVAFINSAGSPPYPTAVLDGLVITQGNADSDDPVYFRGGGLNLENANPIIRNCVISRNKAVWGGGVRNQGGAPRFINCVISDNQAVYGGGLRLYLSLPTLVHCTVTNNLGTGLGGGISQNDASPLIVNSIFWGNRVRTGLQQINIGSGNPLIRFSDIQGGRQGIVGLAASATYQNNIDADPLLTQDYRPRAGSPCIDSGDPATLVTTDIDGEARSSGKGFDMGADEFVDTDGDGLPDFWEILHGLDPRDNGSVNVTNGAGGDLDGDGKTNLEEYIENTSPSVAADNDGDGFAAGQGDCDDADPAINPKASEICDDRIDNNCNGKTDADDPYCVTLASTNHYFPAIKDDDTIGWANYLTVAAKDPVAMDVTILVFDMAGILKGTYIYSDIDPAANAPAIPPYARVAQRPCLIASGSSTTCSVPVEGSMIVETSVPAIATTNTISNSFEGFSIVESAKPRSVHNFPKAFDGPNNYQVYVLVQNIHATARNITATLYGKNASSPGHGAKLIYTIPAYGTLKFRPSNMAGGVDFNGSVVVTSDGPTPGDGLGAAIPAMCRYELGKEAMTIYESTVAQPALYFPTVKDGKFGGAMDYQNYLSVVNPGTADATVEVILHTNAGVKKATTGPFVITAGGKATWRPSMILGTVTAPVDFEGAVSVTSTAPVVGQTNTMYPGVNTYQCDAFDLFESAMPNTTLFFPKAFDNIVADNHLYDNVVYVQNPDEVAKNITIEQFNNNGSANGARTVPLGPNATYVYRPKDLVTDGTGQFRGSVRVTETGGGKIAGAIKYDIHQGTTTSTPVDAMTLYRSMGQ